MVDTACHLTPSEVRSLVGMMAQLPNVSDPEELVENLLRSDPTPLHASFVHVNTEPVKGQGLFAKLSKNCG